MVLVDTSIVIDFINHNKYKDIIIALLSDRKFCTTEIIIMEVLQGIRDEKTYKEIKFFLESLPLIELKYEDYIMAAGIYRICRKKGLTIRKSFDCIIAAVVINNDLELFSSDRDFDSIQKHFDFKRYQGEARGLPDS